MLAIEQLKTFILSDNYHVRFEVVKYFHDGWIQDTDVLPLVLSACQKYGFKENRLLLYYCDRQPQDAKSLDMILTQLKETDDYDLIYTFNHLLRWTRLDLLEERRNILNKAKLTQHVADFLNHRVKFSDMTPQQLWRQLQSFAEQSKDARYVNDIDHHYSDALIETLAQHNIPDETTIYDLLQLKENDNHWLEIFLIDLAGARKLSTTVPLLTNRFRVDTDYMLERCNRSLARIGNTDAVSLVRKNFATEPWYYQNYAASVFSNIKSSVSEEALLALRQENDIQLDIRDRLCFCLCNLFSTHSIEWGREIIEQGRAIGWADMRQKLLVVGQINGIELPEAEQWRVEIEQEEEERQRRGAMFQEALEQAAKAKSKQSSRDAAVSIRSSNILCNFAEPTNYRNPGTKVARNEPCLCGSGKKYKKCCGRVDKSGVRL